MPPDTVMRIHKPLYNIPEAGTHGCGTCIRHHCEKLSMNQSTYDPCLLYLDKQGLFGVVGMQTNDTLILANDTLAKLEDEQLLEAKIMAKPIEKLNEKNPLFFNGCKFLTNNKDIKITQKIAR